MKAMPKTSPVVPTTQPELEVVMVLGTGAPPRSQDTLLRLPGTVIRALNDPASAAEFLAGHVLTTPEDAEDYVNHLLSKVNDGALWTAALVEGDGDYSIWDPETRRWKLGHGAQMFLLRNDTSFPGEADGNDLGTMVRVEISVNLEASA